MPGQEQNIATIFQTPHSYLKKIKHPLLTGFIAAGLFSVVLYVFAVTPGIDVPYMPGVTLDPTNCSPGDPSGNCTVYAPVTYSGANSDIDLNGHSFTNVGTGSFGTLQVGGYKFPTSTGSAGQVLSAVDASGTLSWANPSTTSIFVGLTTSPRVALGGFSYSGYTGYTAGDHMCSDEPGLSGSHMCSTSEILYTISTNLGSLATSGFAWVNGGAQGSSNDCDGHSPSVVPEAEGAIWIFDNAGGAGYLTDCGLSGNGGNPIPLACCK